MSGLSNFLTQGTAPWWGTPIGVIGGACIAFVSTYFSDKRKKNLELKTLATRIEREDRQRWDRDLREFAAKFLAATWTAVSPTRPDRLDDAAQLLRLNQYRVRLNAETISEDEQATIEAEVLFLLERKPADLYPVGLMPMRQSLEELLLIAPAPVSRAANELAQIVERYENPDIHLSDEQQASPEPVYVAQTRGTIGQDYFEARDRVIASVRATLAAG